MPRKALAKTVIRNAKNVARKGARARAVVKTKAKRQTASAMTKASKIAKNAKSAAKRIVKAARPIVRKSAAGLLGGVTDVATHLVDQGQQALVAGEEKVVVGLEALAKAGRQRIRRAKVTT
jgi:hypothetical protein